MERIDIDLLERIRLSALRIQTVCAIKKYLLDKIFWNFIPKKLKLNVTLLTIYLMGFGLLTSELNSNKISPCEMYVEKAKGWLAGS
jgi:hypothetical protein